MAREQRDDGGDGAGNGDKPMARRLLFQDGMDASPTARNTESQLAPRPQVAASVTAESAPPETAAISEAVAELTLCEAKELAAKPIGLVDLFGLATDRDAASQRLRTLERARAWYESRQEQIAVVWLNLAICHQSLQLGELGGLHELCEVDIDTLPPAMATRVEIARSIVATFFGAPCANEDRRSQLRGFPGAIAAAVESLLLGRLDDAVDKSRAAFEVAAARDHHLGCAIARLNEIVADSLRGHDDNLKQGFETALEELERCDAPEVVGLAHLLYGAARFQNGHNELGLRTIEMAKDIFQEIRAYPFLALAQVCQAWVELAEGRLSPATDVLTSACKLFDRLGGLRGGLWAQFFLAEAHLRAGDHSAAIVRLRQVTSPLELERNHYVHTLALSRLAVALAHNGQHELADRSPTPSSRQRPATAPPSIWSFASIARPPSDLVE